MLDKECERTLKRITELCSGGYTVLCDEDFVGINDAESCIFRLSESGYISLKYARGGEYFLALEKSGAEYFSEQQNKLIFKSVLRRECASFSFWGAFSGGVFAAVAAFALYALMRAVFYA